LRCLLGLIFTMQLRRRRRQIDYREDTLPLEQFAGGICEWYSTTSKPARNSRRKGFKRRRSETRRKTSIKGRQRDKKKYSGSSLQNADTLLVGSKKRKTKGESFTPEEFVSQTVAQLLKLKGKLENISKESKLDNNDELDKLFQQLYAVNVSEEAIRESGFEEFLRKLTASRTENCPLNQLSESLKMLWQYRFAFPEEHAAKLKQLYSTKTSEGIKGGNRAAITSYCNISRSITVRLKQLEADTLECLGLKHCTETNNLIVDFVKETSGPLSQLREGDSITQVQQLSEAEMTGLTVSSAMNIFMEMSKLPQGCLIACQRKQTVRVKRLHFLRGEVIDPGALYDTIESFGGINHVLEHKLMRQVRDTLGLGFTTSASHSLKNAYFSYFGHIS